MGVVLVMSNASGGMGSDIRGHGGAMGVSLVDSSDVRGLGEGHGCGSGGQQWVNESNISIFMGCVGCF